MKLLWNPTVMTFDLEIGNWPPCEGVQKLGGFGKGLAFHRVDYFPYWHHSNSIRLGYNRDTWKSPIRLFMYAYVKGELIDPKECVIGDDYKPETKIEATLKFNKYGCAAIVKEKRYSWPTKAKVISTNFKTLPIGYQLYPYAETDGTNPKEIPFNIKLNNVVIR